MTHVIRPAHAGDPAELARIGTLTFDAYATDGFVADHDAYADHLRDAADRAAQAELYVALDEAGSTLLGTVTFCPEGSSYRELAAPGEAEFRMLAVDPEARGLGVGEALVRLCIERAEELGYHALVLCSMPGQRRAHRIYERIGFRRTPDLDWAPVPTVQLLGYRLDLSR